VGIVVDEGLLDEHVKVVEGDAEGAALQGFLGEVLGDFASDVRDEALVLLVEDVLLALGEQEVGKGTADGVGDLAQVKTLFAVGAEDLDLGDREVLAAEDVAPVVVGFLVGRGYAKFLEGKVLGDGRRIHGRTEAEG
jgi:hypothetical protein